MSDKVEATFHGTSDDPVASAFQAGRYTATDGREFSRGMDGWFSDGGTSTDADGVMHRMTMIKRHDDMAAFIRSEAVAAQPPAQSVGTR